MHFYRFLGIWTASLTASSCNTLFSLAALNMSVFLLIGRSSALTMNIAGVLKDWLLIMLSMVMFKAPVTSLQFFGYGIAFAGVCWYNYQKIQAMKPASGPKPEERQPLLSGNKP